MTDRGILAVAACLLMLCTAAASVVAGAVQKQRSDLGLIIEMEGVAGMPPHVAVVTAALGTFRGLAVDVLWARADSLEMNGDFYEAQTLAQWITTLQPRFQKVWSFQAWNMAWNISAATQVRGERWNWVERGIDLLRTKGIPLNPQAANLYFDLAWIFQNKIGSTIDKEHWYYKARFAEETQEILGDLVQGRSMTEAIIRFKKISDAPATFEELEARCPHLQRGLELLDQHGAAADEATLRMLGRVMMYVASLDAKFSNATLPQGVNRGLIEALRKDREAAEVVFDHLVPYLQRRVLQEHYRMDPGKMLTVMEQYGPLDWRHPHAHGVYWSEQGVDVSRTLDDKAEVNELLLIRSRLLMLMGLMRAGRVDYDPVTDRVDFLPDPRFARKFEEAVHQAFDLIASEDGVAAADFGAAEEADLFASYEKFLNLATMLAYLYGDEAEAERYFVVLKDLMDRQGYGDLPAFTGTLENFVAIRFAGMVEVHLSDLRQVIDAMAQRAFLEGLARGDLKVFNRFLAIARSVYDKRYGAAERGEAYVLEQAQLASFPKLVENSFESLMKQAKVPVLTRARVWNFAPESLRQATYPALSELLIAEAAASGLDPGKAFPQPEQPKETKNQDETTGIPGTE